MKKGIGEKVLGWFIVEEVDGAAKPAADPPEPLPSEAPARTRPSPSPAKTIEAPRAASDMLRAAGLPDTERERLRRVMTLVATLPAEATLDVKRAIVAASLEAFGIRIDDLVVSGEGAIGALDAMIEAARARSEQTIAQASSKVDQLTREIAALRAAIDAENVAVTETVASVEAEKARLSEAIAFFARPRLTDSGLRRRP